MPRQQPPLWLQAWRRLASTFLSFESTLVHFMMRAIQLGLRPRAWLAHQDPMNVEILTGLQDLALKPCQHPANMIQRSGNRHGRYARCRDCNMKWKWNGSKQDWDEQPFAKRSSLPLPSSENSLVAMMPSSTAAARQLADPPLTLMGSASTSLVPPLLNSQPKVLPTPRPRFNISKMATRRRSPSKRRKEEEAEEFQDPIQQVPDSEEEYAWDLVG